MAFKLLLYIFIFFGWLTMASTVDALVAPDFSACTNPTGTIIAKYDTGTHGIVGQTATYTGSDIVYQMNDNQVLQCFCPDNGGAGIQTHWWKVPTLSDSDRNIFTKQGWIYVPNGKLWGLANSSYLARNTEYSCNGVGGGNILGISTLAATGSGQTQVILGMFGLIAIGVGLKKFLGIVR